MWQELDTGFFHQRPFLESVLELNSNSMYRQKGTSPLDFSPVDSRKIPKGLEGEITGQRINQWSELIEDIIKVDKDFGPVREWTLFTEIYEIPHHMSDTALLVNCSKERCGQIASLLRNSLENISIDIIYSDFDDYLRDYKNWSENPIAKNERKKISENTRKTGKIGNEDLYKICTEFSGYIRIKKDLPLFLLAVV